MTNMAQFTTRQLEESRRNLERAKTQRSGSLMRGEQKALNSINAELERRADVAYCKAHVSEFGTPLTPSFQRFIDNGG